MQCWNEDPVTGTAKRQCRDGTWHYVGEGGCHAIFTSLRRNDAKNNSSSNTARNDPQAAVPTPVAAVVLRVTKEDLVLCERIGTEVEREDLVEHAEDPSLAPQPFRFTTVASYGRLFAPLYWDKPQLVPLSWDTLRQLRRQALNSGRIPPARRDSWNATAETSAKQRPTNCRHLPGRSVAWGMVLPDYRFLVPSGGTPALLSQGRVEDPSTASAEPQLMIVSSSGQETVSCCCVEIKPKAGYCAISPLVHPHRRIKYQYTRFVLLQELWKQGHIHKSWASTNTYCQAGENRTNGGSPVEDETITTSSYDPLDLFSQSRIRIQTALKALCKTPQNNWQVWCNGQPLDIGSESVLCDAWHFPHRQYNTNDMLVSVVSEILSSEPFLQQLLELQELDILDGDGAMLVYHRFVQLCDDNHQVAQCLLGNIQIIPEENGSSWKSPHELLQASPLVPPSDPSRVVELCRVIQQTKDLLQSQPPPASDAGVTMKDRLDELHEVSQRLVQSLDAEDCKYVLQNWLLSLTMNDVSFFVCLTVVENYDVDSSGCDNAARSKHTTRDSPLESERAREDRTCICKEDEPIRVHVTSLQAPNQPGLVRITDVDEQNESIRLQYQIKVIDCDPKPARKLRNREAKEACFARL